MLASSPFFKLFPPPALMLMPYAGLDISDDALHCLAFSGVGARRRISSYGRASLPPGLLSGGDIKDEDEFVSLLSAFARENGLGYVKASIPEEKAYLFQTDVPMPMTDMAAVRQNVEFKLEENVPLSASDALFYFDLLPSSETGESVKASVSVVPRTYIDHYISLLRKAGLSPLAFEVTPKAIARAVVRPETYDTRIIVDVMARKTGIHIVSGNAVSFSSTVAFGGEASDKKLREDAVASLVKEIDRVRSFWASHGNGRPVSEVVMAGRYSPAFKEACEGRVDAPVRLADVWTNSLDLEKSLPPISRDDSMEYAAAAGLAFDLPTGP